MESRLSEKLCHYSESAPDRRAAVLNANVDPVRSHIPLRDARDVVWLGGSFDVRDRGSLAIMVDRGIGEHQ